VWERRVPTFISWAMAPEMKANENTKTVARISTLFITTPPFWLKIYVLIMHI
jgi:hypothetical protein